MKPEKVSFEIINEPPKGIYERAAQKWGVSFEDTVFTVGNKIYAKYGVPLDLLAHELVHIQQQKDFEGGHKAWWDRYFEDDKFRLEQEVEAYKVQCEYIKDIVKDRNQQNRYISNIAFVLSGKQYGNLIGYNEALRILK
jgi:hypothetical protein